ncbi:MAG: RagB/SusD family nutrient uptake outer membrane protein [Bacteroidaceae bacterium]|nr:RagB/SusD family nutrient uptake outer membrane protein [Bacteroidaceae bacterium]
MKKIYLLAVAAAFAFTSCENFLDTTNNTQANTSNFPAQPSDLDAELSALYSVMNAYASDPLQTPFFIYNIMSDDCNGAGGTGDVESHAIGHLMTNKTTLYDNTWSQTYIGISRANTIIYSVDNFDWTGKESTRDQLLGEAYFMRGLYYLWGTQLWGNIPAYWSIACPTSVPQQDAETVIYPHILADFVSAAALMNKKVQGDGHATKFAAEGYLARAYMFYEGFYKHVKELAAATPDAIELPEQEGVTGPLTKAQVVSALEDVINNGGYSLVSDFRLLWQYTNQYTAADYDFVSDLNAAGKYWAGNGNAEEIFQIQFGNFASWNGANTMGYTNMTSLYCSLRCDEDASGNINGKAATFPFAQGWGQGVFNTNLWNDWSDSDPRKRATILNCDAELTKFAYTTSCSEETGFYNKKVMAVTTKATADNDMTAGPYTWWSVVRESFGASQNNGNCMQGDHFADIVLLRLADVMLMHSELTGDATQMNKVRARAGLDATTYSLTNIQNERRFELAGEGIRFNDLRRWSGKNGGEGCMAATALERQNGSKVNYTGTWTTMKHAASSWKARYAETDGFLPIPETEIAKVNDPDVLKQNPGWYSASKENDYNMSGTPIY